MSQIRLAVVGLGRVGLPFAVFLSKFHRTIGVDLPDVVGALESEGASFREPGLAASLAHQTSSGRLALSTRVPEGVDIAFLCLPSDNDGVMDASVVRSAAYMLKEQAPTCQIVVRSTVPVGTTRMLQSELGQPVVHFPEFLREGSALEDLSRPRYAILGTQSEMYTRRLSKALARCGYPPLRILTPDESELFKIAVNGFHALRVSFVNNLQMAVRTHKMDVDIEVLMGVLVLNDEVLRSYLRPGMPYGGACLDLAVNYLASLSDEVAGLFDAVRRVRSDTIRWLGMETIAMLKRVNGESVGIIGVAFKAGTGDVRSTPSIDLAVQLVRGGATVLLFDPEICQLALADQGLRLATNLDEVLEADILVLSDMSYADLIRGYNQPVLLPSGRWENG